MSSFACSLPHLLVLLPYQLGFHPVDSLVVVAIRDGVVDHVERTDLPVGALDPWTTARLVGGLRRRGAEESVVVAFGSGPAAGRIAVALGAAVAEHVSVLRVVVVHDGRFRELPCGWWEDLPHAADVPIVAEYVGRGVAPLLGREAIRESLAPREDARFRRALRATPDPCTFVALRAWSTVVAGEDDEGDLLVALAALRDTRVRDDVLGHLVPLGLVTPGRRVEGAELVDRSREGVAVEVRARLARVARMAPPEVRAAALCVVALWAWDSGDGATAGIAAEEALAHDDAYELARLVSQLVCLGIRPAAWGGSTDGVRRVSNE